eukprot:14302-Pelagococcus_subviridis.AAC.1
MEIAGNADARFVGPCAAPASRSAVGARINGESGASARFGPGASGAAMRTTSGTLTSCEPPFRTTVTIAEILEPVGKNAAGNAGSSHVNVAPLTTVAVVVSRPVPLGGGALFLPAFRSASAASVDDSFDAVSRASDADADGGGGSGGGAGVTLEIPAFCLVLSTIPPPTPGAPPPKTVNRQYVSPDWPTSPPASPSTPAPPRLNARPEPRVPGSAPSPLTNPRPRMVSNAPDRAPACDGDIDVATAVRYVIAAWSLGSATALGGVRAERRRRGAAPERGVAELHGGRAGWVPLDVADVAASRVERGRDFAHHDVVGFDEGARPTRDVRRVFASVREPALRGDVRVVLQDRARGRVQMQRQGRSRALETGAVERHDRPALRRDDRGEHRRELRALERRIHGGIPRPSRRVPVPVRFVQAPHAATGGLRRVGAIRGGVPAALLQRQVRYQIRLVSAEVLVLFQPNLRGRLGDAPVLHLVDPERAAIRAADDADGQRHPAEGNLLFVLPVDVQTRGRVPVHVRQPVRHGDERQVDPLANRRGEGKRFYQRLRAREPRRRVLHRGVVLRAVKVRERGRARRRDGSAHEPHLPRRRRRVEVDAVTAGPGEQRLRRKPRVASDVRLDRPRRIDRRHRAVARQLHAERRRAVRASRFDPRLFQQRIAQVPSDVRQTLEPVRLHDRSRALQRHRARGAELRDVVKGPRRVDAEVRLRLQLLARAVRRQTAHHRAVHRARCVHSHVHPVAPGGVPGAVVPRAERERRAAVNFLRRDPPRPEVLQIRLVPRDVPHVIRLSGLNDERPLRGDDRGPVRPVVRAVRAQLPRPAARVCVDDRDAEAAVMVPPFGVVEPEAYDGVNLIPEVHRRVAIVVIHPGHPEVVPDVERGRVVRVDHPHVRLHGRVREVRVVERPGRTNHERERVVHGRLLRDRVRVFLRKEPQPRGRVRRVDVAAVAHLRDAVRVKHLPVLYVRDLVRHRERASVVRITRRYRKLRDVETGDVVDRRRRRQRVFHRRRVSYRHRLRDLVRHEDVIPVRARRVRRQIRHVPRVVPRAHPQRVHPVREVVHPVDGEPRRVAAEAVHGGEIPQRRREQDGADAAGCVSVRVRVVSLRDERHAAVLVHRAAVSKLIGRDGRRRRPGIVDPRVPRGSERRKALRDRAREEFVLPYNARHRDVIYPARELRVLQRVGIPRVEHVLEPRAVFVRRQRERLARPGPERRGRRGEKNLGREPNRPRESQRRRVRGRVAA